MSDDPPAELVELQRAFLTADLQCVRLADTHPPARDIVAGRAALTDQQQADYQAARAERGRLVAELNRHPWWDTVPNRHAARQTLLAAARAGHQAADEPAP